MTNSISDNQEYADLITPNYEGHYRKLLATIKEYAAAPRPDVWSIVLGLADTGWLTAEREFAYCGDISLLATQLVYVDLGSIGIEPNLARLILLARLSADDAPISHLRDEMNVAIADVIEACSAPDTSADTVPAASAKPLFSARMWPITPADVAPVPVAAESPAEEAQADLAISGLDLNKWFGAMPTQGVA